MRGARGASRGVSDPSSSMRGYARNRSGSGSSSENYSDSDSSEEQVVGNWLYEDEPAAPAPVPKAAVPAALAGAAGVPGFFGSSLGCAAVPSVGVECSVP